MQLCPNRWLPSPASSLEAVPLQPDTTRVFRLLGVKKYDLDAGLKDG